MFLVGTNNLLLVHITEEKDVEFFKGGGKDLSLGMLAYLLNFVICLNCTVITVVGYLCRLPLIHYGLYHVLGVTNQLII